MGVPHRVRPWCGAAAPLSPQPCPALRRGHLPCSVCSAGFPEARAAATGPLASSQLEEADGGRHPAVRGWGAQELTQNCGLTPALRLHGGARAGSYNSGWARLSRHVPLMSCLPESHGLSRFPLSRGDGANACEAACMVSRRFSGRAGGDRLGERRENRMGVRGRLGCSSGSWEGSPQEGRRPPGAAVGCGGGGPRSGWEMQEGRPAGKAVSGGETDRSGALAGLEARGVDREGRWQGEQRTLGRGHVPGPSPGEGCRLSGGTEGPCAQGRGSRGWRAPHWGAVCWLRSAPFSLWPESRNGALPSQGSPTAFPLSPPSPCLRGCPDLALTLPAAVSSPLTPLLGAPPQFILFLPSPLSPQLVLIHNQSAPVYQLVS